MNVEILARFQFAFTIAFHYIFPPLSIGLGLLLVFMEGAWLRTGNDMYKRMAHFWVKVFALTFGVGVATGIVMEFEFGTNWASYSRYVGDIFGSALAAEGVFAFFLESGFLAILVFGWHKVSKGWHFFSTCMVSLGSMFSAVWIVVANSWMQTPAGYKIVTENGRARAEITDFWAMVFNPSSVDRLAHTVVGAWIAGAFLVTSVSAYYLLKDRHIDFAKGSMKIGLTMALFASVLQIFVGSRSAEGVAVNQPSKMAALEGHWNTGPMDLTLIGWVDEANKKTVGLTLPGMGSFLLAQDAKHEVKGLNDIPADLRPPIQPTFQAYHLMVAIGFALALLAILANVKLWRGTLWDCKPTLHMLLWAVILPQIANQVGWFAAEVGRQPWIVFGMMKTSDGLSKVVGAGHILTSIILFGLVYVLLFFLFLYLLDRRIKAGPDDLENPEPMHAPQGVATV